jgi:PAS domain S-box-containing protein
MHDAVVVINAEGTIVYANRSYAREIGVQPEKIIGMQMEKIAPGAVALEVLKTGQAYIERPHRIARIDIDTVVNSVPLYQDGILVGAVSVFRNVNEIKRLNEELERMKYFTNYLRKQLDLEKKLPEGFKNIIGSNKSFRDMILKAMKASQSDITVLISGETGTGKDLVARAIHNSSRRNRGPFIEINCAAIPESLLESELFGFEDGAFTGARKGGKPGKFELAHGGTLFLDEIGDMSVILQAKLLHALQEKQIVRVGGTKTIRTDVRIIAATNQDLETRIEENKFRADLFYRLNVYSINMIPLRDRKDDIPLLSTYFLKKFTEREKKNIKLSSATLEVLINYNWAGNVRELQNIIESAVVTCELDYIEAEDLPEYMILLSHKNKPGSHLTRENGSSLNAEISRIEQERILEVLDNTGNNRSKAIKILGISRSAFYQKIAKYGIK